MNLYFMLSIIVIAIYFLLRPSLSNEDKGNILLQSRFYFITIFLLLVLGAYNSPRIGLPYLSRGFAFEPRTVQYASRYSYDKYLRVDPNRVVITDVSPLDVNKLGKQTLEIKYEKINKPDVYTAKEVVRVVDKKLPSINLKINNSNPEFKADFRPGLMKESVVKIPKNYPLTDLVEISVVHPLTGEKILYRLDRPLSEIDTSQPGRHPLKIFAISDSYNEKIQVFVFEVE